MNSAGQVDVLVIGCGPAEASAAIAAHDAGASVWGPFTHSGGGLTDALVFGRLAGQQAARKL